MIYLWLFRTFKLFPSNTRIRFYFSEKIPSMIFWSNLGMFYISKLKLELKSHDLVLTCKLYDLSSSGTELSRFMENGKKMR